MQKQKNHVSELCNNNIKQLEDNIIKSDISFWNNWKDFSKNQDCSDIEISDGHTGIRKNTFNTEIYNEKVTDNLQFLEDETSNVNLMKKSPENKINLTLEILIIY